MADSRNSDHTNPHRPRSAAGPFDGYRLGAIDVPVRIRDLSVEGCRVDISFGVKLMNGRVMLQIDLPGEGWIMVLCEAVEILPAASTVRFVNLDKDTRDRLERTIDRLSSIVEGTWTFGNRA
jgi:hypothetical protein